MQPPFVVNPSESSQACAKTLVPFFRMRKTKRTLFPIAWAARHQQAREIRNMAIPWSSDKWTVLRKVSVV